MKKSETAGHALQALQAVRIIGRLLNHVKLDSGGPILSCIGGTAGELVERSKFGTRLASVSLEIFKNGDIPNQYMFEKWEETALTLGRLSKTCLDEFGTVTLDIKEKVGMKIIIINFKPALGGDWL